MTDTFKHQPRDARVNDCSQHIHSTGECATSSCERMLSSARNDWAPTVLVTLQPITSRIYAADARDQWTRRVTGSTCCRSVQSTSVTFMRCEQTFRRTRAAGGQATVITCGRQHHRLQQCWTLHRESKKTRHQTLGHNFTNYYPIFKIFFTSRLSSKFATNSCLNIPPRFKNISLHYLVKYECRKMASFWNTYCN